MWDGAIVYLSIFSILGLLATLAIVFRFWSTRLLRNTYHLDDWLSLATLVIHHAFTGVIITAFVKEHLGQDTKWVAENHPASIVGLRKIKIDADIEIEPKLLFILTLMFGLTTTTIRLSVLQFYWRILSSKLVRRGCVILIGVCLSWFVAYELASILICLPVEAQWSPTGRDKCTGISKLQTFAGFFNSFVDVATVVLPIREVWHLRLSPWKKRSIIGVFLIGVGASAISIVRAVASVINGSAGAGRISGPSYALLPSTICIEIYLAIIGACAPTLVPAYKKVCYGKAYGSSIGASTHGYSGRLSTGKQLYAPSRKGDTTALRSFSNPQQEGPFERLDDPLERTAPHSHGEHWTDVTGQTREESSSDVIPLQGIKVTKEISWRSEE
ncbi:unnamed protein product [Clonostachys rosea]|uniref:Rhodopsin domain-containing protein n=1 Tax=Bionectria ochroleuca TaxID=29856 RepID=A0ABY6UM33_BIOOC|nr:unnamed protein product [Clonostachys rosea]